METVFGCTSCVNKCSLQAYCQGLDHRHSLFAGPVFHSMVVHHVLINVVYRHIARAWTIDILYLLGQCFIL